MNGLQASSKVTELARKIAAIETIIMNLAGNRDFSQELRILKEMQTELKVEKSGLESRLRSIKL